MFLITVSSLPQRSPLVRAMCLKMGPKMSHKITKITFMLLNGLPDLLVLAQRDGVLLVLVALLHFAVLGRVGGCSSRVSLRSAAVTRVVPIWIAGKELSQVARVGVRELLRDQSLVQGADGVAPLASPWSCKVNLG